MVGLKLGVEIEFELAMRGVEMAVANGARINRQIFLLQVLVYTCNKLLCTANFLNW